MTGRALGRPIRVLVADDDELVRDAVVEVLVADGRFDVVAAVHDADEALAAAARTHPDVVLVDVRMPGGGGARVARELRDTMPATCVVALSSHDDRHAVTEMFRSGVVSYLVKGKASNDDIVRTLADVATGHFSLPAAIGRRVLDELSTHLERAHREELQRLSAEARVRSVLQGSDLEVVYQPIFAVPGGRRVGAEALSRFHAEPTQPPDRWFADAAVAGLGVQLEMLAVRSAIEQLPRLSPDGYLALNVSPATACDPDFQDAVLHAAPDRVVMEVTEHAPVEDYDHFQRCVEPLRAAGVRLAIDDAGAGFASLRHIVALAPDVIKLDVALTRDIDGHRHRRAMARALISFAAEAGCTLVAEGIERPSELATLRELGVGAAQGYLLGRPVPLELLPATWDVDPGPG